MRWFLIGTILLSGIWGAALAISPDQITAEAPHLGARDSGREIIWAGGDDGNGIAFEGGIWDWDTIVTDPLQGWHSIDQTCDEHVYFYRVTEADFIAHGDPCNPMFPDTPGMLWCGIHEDEALWRSFPGGMGYQNGMCQNAISPEHEIHPATEDLAVEFEYFVDMEDGFDFAYAYVLCFDATGELLEERELGQLTGIVGSPDLPATFSGILPAGELNPLTVTVKIMLRVCADGGWSDEDGLYDSACGPFAADNVGVQIGTSSYLYRFNTGPDGWIFEKCPGVGAFMAVVHEDTWSDWLIAAGLSSWTMAENAVTFADQSSGGYPTQPPGHREMGISGPVPRIGGAFPNDTTLVRWDQFNAGMDWHYRLGYMYYPYTTATNPEPHWSPRGGQNVWYYGSGPGCGPCEINLTTLDGHAGVPLPADWDSVRFVLEVYNDYWPREITFGAPMLDNVQVGIQRTASSADEEISRNNGNQLYASRWDPHHAGAHIRFHLGEMTHVNLSLFDATGRQVEALLDGTRTTGEHFINWDGAGQSAGVYWVRMQTSSGFEASTRLLITN